MTVKDAMNEINSLWPRMSKYDKKDVKDHWFWSVIVPGLSETDEMPQQDWDDILQHIIWYYNPVPDNVQNAEAEPKKEEA